MCDPTGGLLTSAVVTGLGTAASMYGQSKQQEAYNKVANEQAAAQQRYNQSALALQNAERQRQQDLTGRSTAALNQSLSNNSLQSQSAQEAELRNALANKYSSAASSAADVSSIPGLSDNNSAAPAVVADTYKQAFGNVGNYLRQQAGSKAALDAYGNLGLNQNIANTRQLQGQSLLGNFMQGSSNVLGNELAANKEASDLAFANAQNAGNGLLQQAALFNGLGQIGTSIGAQGFGGTLGTAKAAAAAKAPYASGFSFTPQFGMANLFTPKAGKVGG